MKIRNPGSEPKLNERIQYVQIEKYETKSKKLLQGDKIETVDYVKKNNLPIDYMYYVTNQIMTPALQFLELIVFLC